MKLKPLALAALVVCASVVCADLASAGTLTIGGSKNRTGNGGEFWIDGFDDAISTPASVVNQVDNKDFETFCIEYNESISLGGTYNYDISTEAVLGGSGGGSPDPLGEATAKLYYTFWMDQWDVAVGIDGTGDFNLSSWDGGYDYSDSSTRGQDGSDLQLALWYLEGERTWDQLTAVAKEMVKYAQNVEWSDLGQGGWDDDNASTVDIGNVRVLNLWRTVDGKRVEFQSQLVVVPLPAAALMGLGLLAGLGVMTLVRRRRRLGSFA